MAEAVEFMRLAITLALSGVARAVKPFVGLVQALVPISSAADARTSSPVVDGVTLGVAPLVPFAASTDDVLSSVNGPPVHSDMTTRLPHLSAALGVQVIACLTPACGLVHCQMTN